MFQGTLKNIDQSRCLSLSERVFLFAAGHQQAVPATGEPRGHSREERGTPIVRNENTTPNVSGQRS